MKKALFLLSMAVAFIACHQKTEQTAQKKTVIKETKLTWDDAYYQEDTILAKYAVDNESLKDFSQIYFVKTWNTPDYFAYSSSPTGVSWDGQIFFGKRIGDKVFYVDQYKTSKRYRKETGDSIILLTKFFPADGVTTDPRQTAWWLSSIHSPRTSNLDSFIMEATLIRDSHEVAFVSYKENLKAEILKCQGSDKRKKVITFTAQTVKGKPESWDAWAWPGYYGQSKKVDQTSKI
ncbi:MAG: hypothetical protein QG594_2461 [Bacteroidota bacterium]|nr:hypothetical protein [Bacteroidota bacterium]